MDDKNRSNHYNILMKTHSALAVANWFLDRGSADHADLSPMKLQKLIYFAHGWSLAINDVPLIQEFPEAWDYGPVIPSVYHEFKKFGGNPITQKATKLDADGALKLQNLLRVKFVEPKITDDQEAERLLAKIWEVYGKLTGIQLSNMTHAKDGAWYKAYHELAQGRRGVDIPDNLIKAEFIAKASYGTEQDQPASA